MTRAPDLDADAQVSQAAQPLHGLLLVDKPAGISSHDVVGRVRRALRTRRVGHAGTLDPFATGLLVCAIGRSTRLLQYVNGEPKLYRTRIVFGMATDTDDATGVTFAQGPPPQWERLDSALVALTGDIEQVPPDYSAKHVDGERAYAKARRGERVALAPVVVRVMQWDVTARGDDWLEADITCGGGTYIRALSRDLGAALGTVAHCASLRRLASGPLHVDDATPFDALVPGADIALMNAHVAMNTLATEVVSNAGLDALRVGRQIPATVQGVQAVLVNDAGDVIGVATRAVADEGDRWQPRVVLLSSEESA